MDKLYVTHTPYHVLLAAGNVIGIEGDHKNILIIFQDFDINSIEISVLKANFDQVIIMDGTYLQNQINRYNSLQKFLLKLKDISQLKRHINRYKFGEVFIFNDNSILDKKVMQLVSKKRDCEFIYIEDGSAAYNNTQSFEDNLSNRVKCYLKKLIFGLGGFGEPVKVIGANSYFKECMVLFPGLIRPELRNKNIKEITTDKFKRGIASVYSSYLNNIDIQDQSVILFLDLYEYILPFKETYIQTIQTVMETCKKFNKKIYIKYHPREKVLYLQQYTDLYLLDGRIPSEVILFKCKDDTVIVSSISTSLITANKLSEYSLKISLMDLLNIRDDQLKLIFSKMNVIVPKNLNSLNGVLRKELIKA